MASRAVWLKTKGSSTSEITWTTEGPQAAMSLARMSAVLPMPLSWWGLSTVI